MDIRHAAVMAGLALGLVGGQADASVLTYYDTAVGSGSFGAQSFTDAKITVSFTGNTDTIVNTGNDFYSNITGVGSVTVQGLGSAVLLQPEVFSNNIAKFAGISAYNGIITRSVLDTSNSAFATYALGPIGPTTGSPFYNSGTEFATSAGNFEITSINGNSTFYTSAVPLPASAPMFGAALMAFGAVGYGLKRKSKAATAA